MSVTKRIPEAVEAPTLSSSLFRNRHHPRCAARLAHTTKRLEQCAAQLGHRLRSNGDVRVEGARRLEHGVGWVLRLDPRFARRGERDPRTSHLGFWARHEVGAA